MSDDDASFQNCKDSKGLSFEALPSEFAEDLNIQNFDSISAFVKETAILKSTSFIRSGPNPFDLIIAADTVVVLNNEVIGKPKNKADAKNILKKLSGTTHMVTTGVSLMAFKREKGKEAQVTQRVLYEETEVKFAELTPEMIDCYVNTEEPMGKAGAYAIQGLGATFIEGIKGDYYNVVGFPVHRFCKEMLDLYEKDLF